MGGTLMHYGRTAGLRKAGARQHHEVVHPLATRKHSLALGQFDLEERKDPDNVTVFCLMRVFKENWPQHERTT
jgi:hypothetical protein